MRTMAERRRVVVVQQADDAATTTSGGGADDSNNTTTTPSHSPNSATPAAVVVPKSKGGGFRLLSRKKNRRSPKKERKRSSFFRREGIRREARGDEDDLHSSGSSAASESALSPAVVVMRNTHVVPTSDIVTTTPTTTSLALAPVASTEITPPESESYHHCAALLQQSYLMDYMCGGRSSIYSEETTTTAMSSTTTLPRHQLSDDPTVQESIECIFASQLPDEWLMRASTTTTTTQPPDTTTTTTRTEVGRSLMSPAPLMQSRQKSRSQPSNNLFFRRRLHPSSRSRSTVTTDGSPPKNTPPEQPRKECLERQPPSSPDMVIPQQKTRCFCQMYQTPALPPEAWPQFPLLFRPTPGSGTVVKGVRFANNCKDYIWKPSEGGNWIQPLYDLFQKDMPPEYASLINTPSCPSCCLLPINNGNEPLGQALVVDFESRLFEGSLLLRLRHTKGGATTMDPNYHDDQGYFCGLNRRYQSVIRGRFKQDIPLTSLLSGLYLERPFGRLPPKWILKGTLKVLSYFAPQLDAQLDAKQPSSLAPLGSTPQTAMVASPSPTNPTQPMDHDLVEPIHAQNCILGMGFAGSTSLQRAKGRKKAFDKLYTKDSKQPTTTTTRIYTFEFLQHLFNFQDFHVELGSMLGSIPMAPIMDGQALPILAMTKDGEKVWSFDVWHEALYPDSQKWDER